MGGVEFLNALKVKGPGGNSNLELETAYKETLAELGKRTSTIQLLRDALYRACEAHLNGMLAKEQYRELLYGYDDLVLTLLAIEGITQTHATDHLTREMEEKSEAPNRSPKNNISLEKVNSHSTENQTTNEIAKEIRLILTSYYDFQKFIYENCHVESYRCREIRNSITKSPNYSQETRNSPP